MSIVFFDLETSGLDPERHEIIQIAAIAVQRGDFRELERYETYVAFDLDKADAAALEVNGYKPELWAGAPSQAQACTEFGAFLRGHADLQMTSKAGKPYRVCQVAGYNVGFDCGFLGATFRRQGEFCPADLYRGLDVMQLALWQIQNGSVPDYRLGTVAAWVLGTAPQGLHDARADIEYTLRLARHFQGRPRGEWA